MNKLFALIIIGSLLTIGIMAFKDDKRALETYPDLDLSKYTGVWFSVYEFPSWFQKDCTDTMAIYEMKSDGKISVVNSCLSDGKVKGIVGSAYPVKESDNSKLIVNFKFFRKGDYNIIHVIEEGNQYKYALVGTKNRDYLWILSRTKEIDDKSLGEMLVKAKGQGFDVYQIQKVVHTIQD